MANLKLASGARRLTVHCRFCGAILPAPRVDNFWVWLRSPEVVSFYTSHREHAGSLADAMVGAEIEVDDDLLPKPAGETYPPLQNLLERMGQS